MNAVDQLHTRREELGDLVLKSLRSPIPLRGSSLLQAQHTSICQITKQ